MAIGGPLAAVFASNLLVLAVGAPGMEEEVSEVPPGEVGLVLGAGPGSQALIHRLEAGVELWESGRVRFLLISGGEDGTGYGETDFMERYLLEHGVPPQAILVDNLGLRTLDSVLRARDVFGLRRIVLVTQRYHLYRAVFLARAAGLEARGLVADGAGDPEFADTFGRECLARVRAVLDVLFRQPAQYPDAISVEAMAASPTVFSFGRS